jgi:hypothetical protein
MKQFGVNRKFSKVHICHQNKIDHYTFVYTIKLFVFLSLPRKLKIVDSFTENITLFNVFELHARLIRNISFVVQVRICYRDVD